MGGSGRRSLVAASLTLALLGASVGSPAALAADRCEASDAPRPPYPSDAVLVHVDLGEYWSALHVGYLVTDSSDPLGDPFGGNYAAWDVGCGPGAILCTEPAPLIVSDPPPSSAYNVVWGADVGAYAIVADPAGYCAYFDEAGEVVLPAAPGEIPVPATIEYYRAGEGSPCHRVALEPVSVPVVDYGTMPDAGNRRILGTFDWTGSVSEVCAAAGEASTAELPPPDPRFGTTEAGAPPIDAGTDMEEPALAPHLLAAAMLARTPGQDASQKARAIVFLFWLVWGIGFAVEEGGTSADVVAERIARFILDHAEPTAWDPGDGTNSVTSVVDDELLDDSPVDGPTSGLDALELPVALHDVGGAPQDPTEVAPPPTQQPGQLTKKQQDQGRVWVSLPAAATVVADGTSKKELKTGVWYQLRIATDGSQLFYNRNGKYLGKNPRREADPLRVRVWVSPEE